MVTTEVKEHPIIMQTDMVRAILDGRKTMTRRVVKPQPRSINDDFDGTWEWKEIGQYYDDLTLAFTLRESCPYGQVGDRLWVRETHYRYGYWIKNGKTKTGRQKWTFETLTGEVRYFDNPPGLIRPNSYREEGWYKRPSIFMPRWASRDNYIVTSIRPERLQDITEADALAEGVGSGFQMNAGYPDYQHIRNGVCTLTQDTAIMSYASLWDSINAKRGYGWANNNWVWVIGFKRITPQ